MEILQRDGFTITKEDLPSIKDLPEVDPFVWKYPDDKPANSAEYLNYCKTALGTGFKYLRLDCDLEKFFLRGKFGNPPHYYKGGSDVLVVPSSAMKGMNNEIIMTIELKILGEEPHKFSEDDISQAIAQVMSANYYYSNITGMPSPVGVLTDLINEWALVWIGTEGNMVYANTETSKDGTIIPLKRCTAIHYINLHLKKCNDLLLDKHKYLYVRDKRNIDELELEYSYGFPSGSL